MKAIGAFVDAVDDIGKSDVEVFARLRQEVTPLLSAPVTPGVAREMQGLSRAAMEYAKANARLSVDADDDAFVALVKALKGRWVQSAAQHQPHREAAEAAEIQLYYN